MYENSETLASLTFKTGTDYEHADRQKEILNQLRLEHLNEEE